jgi:mRNA interferase HigB
MKVHLIKQQTIEAYVITQARSKASFEDWLEKIRQADWQSPNDVVRTFSSADLLDKNCNRIVFDIGGNNYRLIAKYAFGQSRFICLCAG